MAAYGVVVPQPMPWHRRLTAVAITALMRICFATWRQRWRDAGEFPISSGPVIFCVWHNHQIAAMATYQFVRAHWPVKGVAAMISASRDGSLVADVADRLGIKSIRGSSSRRGPQALLEATRMMERDYSIVMLPDGPRGPRHQIKKGIVDLAQLTGRPILPTSSYSSWKICTRGWDRMQIPLPFAACMSCYGEPIWVPREATEAEREQIRLKLEAAMLAITRD
jgi:lysophospholipid acyltransferase (LPLAT)-like uncharacterized protein